jgi:plastocyanin
MQRKLTALGVAGLVAAAFAVPSTAQAAKTVRVADNSFVASSVSVKRGTVIRFRWVGNAPHNVVGRAFKNISARRNGTVRRKTRKRGRFTLRCTIHPGMNLRLRVR